MKRVGMFEAKTHFSALVADALAGQTTIVTRNGKPVAEISPVKSDGHEETRAAIDGMRRLAAEVRKRNGRRVTSAEIRDLINEGRRVL